MVKISKNYAGSVGTGASSITSVMLVTKVLLTISANSSNTIKLGISNADSIKEVKITFEFSKNS